MYDYDKEIIRQAVALKKKSKPLTEKQWNIHNSGSAYCAETSLGAIFEAYKESKSYDEW